MSVSVASASKARIWAVLGIVVLSLLWGYTWVLAKQALGFAPPLTMTVFARSPTGATALETAVKPTIT